MSAAPFRDLFVELPLALFEALQGIGEAAATRELGARAVSRAARRSTLAEALAAPTIAIALCERYGWASCEWSRAAASAEIILGASFPCGHRLWIPLCEMRLASECNLAGAVLELLDEAERAGRPCSCVQPDRRCR